MRSAEVPLYLYHLVYDGEKPPKLPNLPKRKSSADLARGSCFRVEMPFLGNLPGALCHALPLRHEKTLDVAQ